MRYLLFILISLLWGGGIRAEIQLPALVSDNMVLQQNAIVRIWGKAKPNADVVVKVGWDSTTYESMSDTEGNWCVKVKTIQASDRPYEIAISDGTEKRIKNILLGEVWLCGGQSNMEMNTRGFTNQPLNNAIEEVLDYDYPTIRFFRVNRSFHTEIQEDVIGNWRLMTPQTVETMTTIGFNFAKIINRVLKVPVGIIGCYWGGSKIEAWMSEEALKEFGDVTIDPEHLNNAKANITPTFLYNAMLKPVSNYTIKGVLFYQGEANVTDPKLYAKLLPAMVKEWRTDFDNSFPFYYVQLAPFSYQSMGWNSHGIEVALLREAQYNAIGRIANSGIVSTVDIGSEITIHPPDKRTVAKRLAYMALYKTYNIEGFNGETPCFLSHVIENNKIIITIEHAGYGLHSKNEPFMGFEIAGDDKVFYPAVLEYVKGANNRLAVFSDKVEKPVAVRYSFKNYQYGNLYNSYGLAVLPFRTDSW